MNRPCDRNCITCSMGQQIYCAANASMTMFSRIEEIEKRIARIETATEGMCRFGGDVVNPSDSVQETDLQTN